MAKYHLKAIITMPEKLLELFIINQGHTLSYSEIEKAIPELFPNSYLRVTVYRLRRQFLIVNVYETGYRYIGRKTNA